MHASANPGTCGERLVTWALVAVLASACGTAKHGMDDGRYRMNRQAVQVEVIGDTVIIGRSHATNLGPESLRLPPTVPHDRRPEAVRLAQHSFDVDLMTVPVKYRPAAADLQPQLETQVSAALYLGRRTDRYRLHYPSDGYSVLERAERHIGLSGGVLLGSGALASGPRPRQAAPAMTTSAWWAATAWPSSALLTALPSASPWAVTIC